MKFPDEELYQELLMVAKGKLENGEHHQEVEEHLRSRSEDAVMVAVILKEARKAYYTQLQKDGLQKIMIGVFFAAMGFIITLINFGSERSTEVALFGLTTVGIGFVFYGLYRIIG